MTTLTHINYFASFSLFPFEILFSPFEVVAGIAIASRWILSCVACQVVTPKSVGTWVHVLYLYQYVGTRNAEYSICCTRTRI